jgi:hypothetical protein
MTWLSQVTRKRGRELSHEEERKRVKSRGREEEPTTKLPIPPKPYEQNSTNPE